MSNTRFIFKYKPTVDLIWAIMIDVNSTQSARIQRIRHNFFELNLGSDQDFFEAINWYAVKVINVCSRYSMMCSRRGQYEDVRFWNACITNISFILGCSCTFDCWSTHSNTSHELWCKYPEYYKRLVLKSKNHDLP